MIIVRHGQSAFNVVFNATREDPGIEDPGLTPQGMTDARAAAKRLAAESRRRPLTRILASPYARTLATAEILAEALDLGIVVDARIRERAAFSCDIGTQRSKLEGLWPRADFGSLAEIWWHRMELHGEESEAALDLRAGQFARAMAAADWAGTVVVSHWGFIRALTGEAVPNGAVLGFDPAAHVAGRPALRPVAQIDLPEGELPW